MDRCVHCEIGMDSGAYSYSCEVEGPDSLGNAATRHALDQDSLHFLFAFIAFLCDAVAFDLRLGNIGKPIRL